MSATGSVADHPLLVTDLPLANGGKWVDCGQSAFTQECRLQGEIRGGSVCLNRLARLLSGTSAGFMPLREAVG